MRWQHSIRCKGIGESIKHLPQTKGVLWVKNEKNEIQACPKTGINKKESNKDKTHTLPGEESVVGKE